MNEKTITQYENAFSKCKDVFLKKTKDYGTSWRILRARSITDQIYIKAKRIRTIDETGENKVGDSVESEFIGCVNYGIIANIQLNLQDKKEVAVELKYEEAELLKKKLVALQNYQSKSLVVHPTITNVDVFSFRLPCGLSGW